MLKDGMWERGCPHGLTLLWNPNSSNSSVGAAQTQLHRFPSPHLELPRNSFGEEELLKEGGQIAQESLW